MFQKICYLETMLEPQKPKIEAEKEKQIRFELGEIITTPGAIEAFKKSEVSPNWFLAKHQDGDWGEVSEYDLAQNEISLKEGFRLLSAYTLPKTGEQIWVITEADRLLTTLLLPEEY